MKDYLCQVRYNQMGEVKSIVHRELADTVIDAATQVAERLENEKVVAFNVNERDWFIIRSADVLNVAVVRGE